MDLVWLVPATGLLAVVFLILRAFSSGATALTGVEAIANGLTAFRAPESSNAATTMAWMGGILAAFFLGATFLVTQLQLVPWRATRSSPNSRAWSSMATPRCTTWSRPRRR